MKNLSTAIQLAVFFQIALWIVIILNILNVQLIAVREIIGFIYLTFIPGLLLLDVLNLQNLPLSEKLLYSVGLSISLTLTLGVALNQVLILVGISNPISITPLLSSMSVLVVGLCAFNWRYRKAPVQPIGLKLSKKLLIEVLFLALILLVSVIGTLFVRESSILILLSIVLITVTVLLATFDRLLSKSLYPLALVIIALSLFYQFTLLSPYLTGADIHLEYHFANLVINNSYWNLALPDTLNSVAGVVILSPIYSIFLGMDNAWVFKIIYPFFFALVPLGLCSIYKELTNEKFAFLAVFFSISFFGFFTELLGVARQQIAELFVVLLILLVLQKNMKPRKRLCLCLIFAASLAVSHYSLAYIFLFFFMVAPSVLLLFFRSAYVNRIVQTLRRGMRVSKGIEHPLSNIEKNNFLTLGFVMFFACFVFSWYLFVSSSTSLYSLGTTGNKIFANINAIFFSDAGQSAPLITQPLQHQSIYFFQYILTACVFIGLLWSILKPEIIKANREFFAMMLCSSFLLLGAILLPSFSNSLGMTRLYQIALLCLAPLGILGGIGVINAFNKFFKHFFFHRPLKSTQIGIFFLSMILISYFLLNTGFVSEVTGDVPFSISLNPGRMENGNNNLKVFFSAQYTYKSEVSSATWLAERRSAPLIVYSDVVARFHVLSSYGMIPLEDSYPLSNNNTSGYSGYAYVYLGKISVLDGLLPIGGDAYLNSSQIVPLFGPRDKIYSNGQSDIYWAFVE
jgi:uncharacterized membrane protein